MNRKAMEQFYMDHKKQKKENKIVMETREIIWIFYRKCMKISIMKKKKHW